MGVRKKERTEDYHIMTDNNHCEDCGWWTLMVEKGSLNSEEKGRCRGRAPTVTAVVMPVVNQIANTVAPQIIEVTVWPVTPAACKVCGDFVARMEPVKMAGEKSKE